MLAAIALLSAVAIIFVINARDDIRADSERARRQQRLAEREKTLAKQRDHDEVERQAELNRRVEIQFGAVYVDGVLDREASVFL